MTAEQLLTFKIASVSREDDLPDKPNFLVSDDADDEIRAPGLAVWHDGHIGVYIGNGEVVEAMGTRYGVVKTKLSNGRWTHWLKIPYIDYD